MLIERLEVLVQSRHERERTLAYAVMEATALAGGMVNERVGRFDPARSGAEAALAWSCCQVLLLEFNFLTNGLWQLCNQ